MLVAEHVPACSDDGAQHRFRFRRPAAAEKRDGEVGAIRLPSGCSAPKRATLMAMASR